MALKKIIDIGETFPVKKPRLGAAPPVEDVLDNVAPPVVPYAAPTPPPVVAPPSALPETRRPIAKPQKPAKIQDGRGVHRGIGTDLRHSQTTGRTYQFGVRTTPEFAETIKQMAAEKRMTLGEVLELLLDAYRAAR